jgi:hypothetical protein
LPNYNLLSNIDNNNGLLVGPRHPIFQSNLQNPIPNNISFSNQRWDPIMPQGFRGWSPDDFKYKDWNSNTNFE